MFKQLNLKKNFDYKFWLKSNIKSDIKWHRKEWILSRRIPGLYCNGHTHVVVISFASRNRVRMIHVILVKHNQALHKSHRTFVNLWKSTSSDQRNSFHDYLNRASERQINSRYKYSFIWNITNRDFLVIHLISSIQVDLSFSTSYFLASVPPQFCA